MDRSRGLSLMLAGAAMCAGATSEAAVQQRASAPGMEVAAAGEELTRLRSAWETVQSLMAQEQLWTNFTTAARQHPRIYVGPSFGSDGTLTADEALALLRGRNSPFIFFPALLTLTGTYYDKGDDYSGWCRNPSNQQVTCRATHVAQNYSNLLAVTHGIGLFPDDSRELVAIEIGRQIFRRYTIGSRISRSCTFNTLAHEWTHTIGKDQKHHWSVVEDTNVGVPQGVPRLSYFFGSVVQCTWLQGEGEIGQSEADLKACVARFAAVPFPSSLCL